MSYPYPQIGIVGGENFHDKKQFDAIFARIISVLQPVIVHVLDKPGASQLAIRWLANHAAIAYKVWHHIPDLKVFCKPLHGVIVINEEGYMEYRDYCLAHHIGLIDID